MTGFSSMWSLFRSHSARVIKKQCIRIFLCSDLLATRFFLSIAALLWSGMLMWPGDTFSRPTYTVMGYLAPEAVWATLFGFQGLVMLSALLYDYRDRVVMVGDCILGCLLWTICTLSMLLSVYPPPAAISAEIAMAFASWWNLVRFLADGDDLT